MLIILNLVYEFYKKLNIALNLCQKENLLKQSPDDEMKHKLKDLQEKVEMFLL